MAHAAPVAATLALRGAATWPIDGGRILWDGQRLLGSSKTWRGLVAAAIATPVTAIAVGQPAMLGLQFAALAMAGDLGTSFVKRRLHRPSGAAMPGLDQLPEALLPLGLLGTDLGLDAGAIAGVVGAFFVLDLIGTRLVAAYKR